MGSSQVWNAFSSTGGLFGMVEHSHECFRLGLPSGMRFFPLRLLRAACGAVLPAFWRHRRQFCSCLGPLAMTRKSFHSVFHAII